MKVTILGGGPTGMALAHGLKLWTDHECTLLERADAMGGLARTLSWKDYGHHDLGPHKIFTKDAELLARVRGLLPESGWIKREKKSRIFMNGEYLPYPPSPFALRRVFGNLKFVSMVLGYGAAQVKGTLKRNNPDSFESDLMFRVGPALYRSLFEPIALKLWGDPKTLDSKLSQGRVQTPSPIEIIGRMLKLVDTSEFEALDFSYPKGGLQKLWEAIEAQCTQTKFERDCEVQDICLDKSKVVSLITKDKKTGATREIEIGDDGFVCSSLPLGRLASMFQGQIPQEIEQKAQNVVQLNDLVLVFLKVKRREVFKDSWVFVPDSKIPFHRISEQKSFDPGMTPQGSILCCELMSQDTRPWTDTKDEELVEKVQQGIKAMGIEGLQVEDSRVIRLPRSYPVFKVGYEEDLKRVLGWFDRIENFKTVGRQGAFSYIGTLDAMDIGYGLAKFLSNQNTIKDAARWGIERQRTSHYPVLD